jgi:hypothetical protein|tara:strand:- start:3182 stop:3496 length:315 start_codon:yes stop_codon:yes gene_type:complete
MSVTSTNSVTCGYRKVKPIPEESKKVFLDTERTVAIREGSIVSVPEVLGGKPLEGRVLFIGDTPNRGLDGRKLSTYFTVCYNEDTLGSLLVFDFEWHKIKVIRY